MPDPELPKDDLLHKLGYEDSDQSAPEQSMKELADKLEVERIPAEVDEELLQKIESIQQEAIQKREQREKTRSEKERSRKGDAEAARGLGVGLSVAYTILGLPMLGLGIGYALDKSLNATAWVPVGVLTGSVLGVWMAIIIINRHQK